VELSIDDLVALTVVRDPDVIVVGQLADAVVESTT